MLSVVIPAYNEEKNIAACLEALTKQIVREPFEVIVVDNNSTDKTGAIARTFEGRLTIRVVHESRKGRGAARARGFAEAAGDIIFSTDADTSVPRQWMEKFLSLLASRPDVVAVTSDPRIEDCGMLRNALFNFFVPLFLRINYLFFRHPGLSGFSFAIRRQAYEKAGGFDPATDAYEDLDLAQRVRKIGKIAVVHGAPVTCSGRRFRGGMLKGWFVYVRMFVDFFIRKKRRVVLSDPR